jgi:caffeoyl-CoA O-methyltransferase
VITNPAIEEYLYGLLPPRDPVLAAMEEEAAARRIPIVGPAVGTLLGQLVAISGAKRIFELGSAIGYSTLWMARAAGPDGEVHYTDSSAQRAAEARRYFERAGVAGRLRLHVGDALQSLRDTPGEFDFIFNDIDKDAYPAALELARKRLKKGGLFVTDNVLWHGEVLNPAGEEARAVVEFNNKLFSSVDLTASLVPLRDGLAIAIRL